MRLRSIALKRSATAVALVVIPIAVTFAMQKPAPPWPGLSRTRPTVMGRNGMVVAAHPLASQAGIDILKRGGNAFDAAVAVASTLNVVEPMMSGMAGLGIAVMYVAETREVRVLEFGGTAPKATNPADYRHGAPDWEQARRGIKSIPVPGNLAGWFEVLETYGTLPAKDVFQSAIDYAENGFPVTPFLATVLQDHDADIELAKGFTGIPEAVSGFTPNAASIFMRGDDEPYRASEILVQKNLAETYKKIVRGGRDVFYKGEVAKAIVTHMEKHGGLITLEDLAGFEAEWLEPISITYRGRYRILTAPPPASSFAGLMKLAIMERYDVAGLGHNSPEFMHLYTEAVRLAKYDRMRYSADPEFDPVPLNRLLSESYIDEKRAEVSSKRAIPLEPPKPEMVSDKGQHTTHFAVADKEGNVIAITQSLGHMFGSNVMVGNTGLWMMDGMYWFDYDPPGLPNDVAPGKRVSYPIMPTIVLEGDTPVLTIGSPGGIGIVETVPQIIMNVLDHGMTIQSAIDAPRMRGMEGLQLIAESRIAAETVAALKNMGHDVQLLGDFTPTFGGAQGIAIDPRTGVLMGGADPRRDGYAIGW